MDDMVYGGRYRVIEKVGAGGMAEVYKAQDEVLGRTVAVKVLHPRYAAEEGFVQRFRQEAQAAANLSSPHIVNIYDWGREGDTYYIVMEYVRGTDLKTLLQQKGRLDPLEAAEYGMQVCSALAVAHGYDVIHRDIKPHNIVLTPDGTVKVMDFGIARAGNTTMTQTGSVMGTAQYLSPEQAQGRALAPASDLYSLGVVLYELTTGRLPFEGDSPVAVALKQVNEMPVPPREVNPAIPAGLEAVILKAMQKDPAERYQSAVEMRADLKRVVEGQHVEAAVPAEHTSVMPAVGAGAVRRVPPRRSYAWVWVLVVLAILAAALAAYAVLFAGPKAVAVPQLVGMTQQEAEAKLAELKLRLGSVDKQATDAKPAGTVLSQDPAPGQQLQEGDSVNLVVAVPVEKVTVPYLIDLDKDEAQRRITDAKLTVGQVTTKEDDKATPDSVLEQDPAGGEPVTVGTAVNLVVAVPPVTVAVPDVTTENQATATKTLKDAGLVVKVKSVFSDQPVGTVVSQNPKGATEVKVGSTVTISVSKGPETLNVPDVTTKSESDATAILRDSGFSVIVNYQDTLNAAEVGTVLTQNPVGGSSAKKGATVTIWVGKSPSMP